MKPISKIQMFALSALTLSFSPAFAGPSPGTIVNGTPPGCTMYQSTDTQGHVSDVQVTNIWRSDGVGPSNLLPPNSKVNSAECVGSISKAPIPLPGALGNLGYYGDGLYNGAPQGANGIATFPTGIFSDQYTAVDLNGDGVKDPGWIYVGSWTPSGASGKFTFSSLIAGLFAQVAPQYGKDMWGNQASSLFELTGGSGNQGSWSFNVPSNVVSIMSQVFGDHLFDQFSMNFFSGDVFSAYDITGAEFGLPIQPFPIYSFGGNWDMSKTLINNGGVGGNLSHMDLYVRDPVGDQTNQVPEPETLGLIGIALAGLAYAGRRPR